MKEILSRQVIERMSKPSSKKEVNWFFEGVSDRHMKSDFHRWFFWFSKLLPGTDQWLTASLVSLVMIHSAFRARASSLWNKSRRSLLSFIPINAGFTQRLIPPFSFQFIIHYSIFKFFVAPISAIVLLQRRLD